MIGVTPGQLLAMAQTISERTPNAELHKNEVGNLAIMVAGAYAGYVDLGFGEVVYWDDDDSDLARFKYTCNAPDAFRAGR